MSNVVVIRIVRPMLVYGARHETGDVVIVDPLDAFDAVGSGRAELVNLTDSEIINRAVREETEAAVRTGERRWRDAKRGSFGGG